MKKAIALCITLLMIAAAMMAASITAADDVLTVTANGSDAKTYHIGDEIVFYVDLDTGDTVILNGDAEINYDPERLELVEHTAVIRNKESVEAYSFPFEIYYGGITLNTDNPGIIKYNFSKSSGIGTFSDDYTMIARFRFKVIAAGEADISHRMITLCDYNENYIYHKGVANEAYHPILTTRTMIADLIYGDVDGSGVVDNRDALILDRYIAGWKGYDALIASPEAADLNLDGKISNRDAILLDRYIAGWQNYDQYVFEVNR